MTIREITAESEWEVFVHACNPATFLHSWAWGQVQKRTGEGVRYLAIQDGDKQIGAALVILVKARRGWHYLIPHGPLCLSNENNREAVLAVVRYLREKAAHDRAVCVRIAPLWEDTPASRETFAALGFRPAPLHVHAELTWVLDIEASEDELLAGMRKTTRHAIKKAQKSGTVAEIITPLAALERFLPIYHATRARHQFVPFSRSFLNAQLEEFNQRGQLFLSIARYQDKDIAAAICVHYGDTVFYHHGASLLANGTPPASHLVQWAAIVEAKRRGAT